ncbi:MAG: ABC transporter permease subunit [Acidobacteria bacterium]|nr:ABC transporter permease subunit [Acidobacteriota bacterium]
MASELRSLVLCAFAALIAGVAISWAVSVWRPRRGGFALTLGVLLAVNLPAVLGLRSPVLLFLAGLPLVLLATAPRFETLNREYAGAARSLGASELRIFLRLILPLSWHSVLLAYVLALYAPFAELLL